MVGGERDEEAVVQTLEHERLEPVHFNGALDAGDLRVVGVGERVVVHELDREPQRRAEDAVHVEVVQPKDGVPLRQADDVQHGRHHARFGAVRVLQQPAAVELETEALLPVRRVENGSRLAGPREHLPDAGLRRSAEVFQNKRHRTPQDSLWNIPHPPEAPPTLRIAMREQTHTALAIVIAVRARRQRLDRQLVQHLLLLRAGEGVWLRGEAEAVRLLVAVLTVLAVLRPAAAGRRAQEVRGIVGGRGLHEGRVLVGRVLVWTGLLRRRDTSVVCRRRRV